MQVLKLFNENNINIPYSLGKEVGFGGADGQVFDIINDKEIVIKLCVSFDDNGSYLNTNKVLSYLRKNPSHIYTHVYDHFYIGSYKRDFCYNQDQEYTLYYYVMEKLNKISDDEKKVFHSILCHEDRCIVKNYNEEQIKKMLDGMSMGLDFDKTKIILFIKALKDSVVIQNDLHVRNIMKNNVGEFKIIDLDRCQLKGDL